jgi:death on curing protein
MISSAEVEQLHKILIDKFGGLSGIRDMGALEAALARPFQTFDQHDLYATPIEKAACLLESVLNNHPFIDGNKRTGYTVMRLFLMRHGIDITANQDEKYEMIIQVASGQKRYEDIVSWLESCNEKRKDF